MKIYKYLLDAIDGDTRLEATVHIHEKFKPLTVKFIDSNIYMWALVDDTSPLVNVKFNIYPTGVEPEEIHTAYIGTIFHKGGTVWHIFTGRNADND